MGNGSDELTQTWAQTIISNVPKLCNSHEPQAPKLHSNTTCFRGSLESFCEVNALESLVQAHGAARLWNTALIAPFFPSAELCG